MGRMTLRLVSGLLGSGIFYTNRRSDDKMITEKQIQTFAARVEAQTEDWYRKEYPKTPENCIPRITVKPGAKYVKVDVGTSGKFMIDESGDIYGIKGYGVIHRGKHYGNLDTIDHFFWGEYNPVKLSDPPSEHVREHAAICDMCPDPK